jgi:cyclase
MLRTRVIPCLQLRGGSLVKTVNFRDPAYIGDPINTVRIFNELEVDELAFVDIEASRSGSPPDLRILREIADECFMPLSYGGGINDIASAERIFLIGFEKLILNSATFTNPDLVTLLAKRYGSQSVVAAVDVKRSLLGRYEVAMLSGTRREPTAPEVWARRMEELGAGEILLTSIDREGTWRGFDVSMTARVTAAVKVPVIANGGAGSLAHIREVVATGGASAVALGSMVVYQSRGMGVLVNFPDRDALAAALETGHGGAVVKDGYQ